MDVETTTQNPGADVTTLEGFGAATKTFFRGLLWSEGAVPVDPAASKEAMMHHALGKQKKDHC